MKKEKNIIYGYKTGISGSNAFQVHRTLSWIKSTQLIFKLYIL